MHEIKLSAGVIEYEDRAGPGSPIVFLHGLLMDETLWTAVADDLAPDHRSLIPVLPLGAHRQGMSPQADLSPRGIAALVTEFLDALDLRDVTLVGNDTGGVFVQLLMAEGPLERIAGAVLVSCDAFDNFPPGLTGRTLFRTGKLPPTLFGLFMQQMRLKPVRRLPLAFGWLTKRGDAVVKRWMRPIWRQPEIRRDTVRVLRTAAADPNLLTDAAEKLARFDRSTLVVWAQNDRVMPPEHGRRLAGLLPDARLVEIEDCYTLIPLDQPARLTKEIRHFLDATSSDKRSA
ncbi:alpha/beta fold hydrolase [Catenulispora rubra]|uniref:alpha/beta fold hydrolase n=1 Tax=Catenulispora rubra TaxID=280293 RepID=UPI0018924C6D|nr:alpha/beta hydrolase [Catenulispora rubra]